MTTRTFVMFFFILFLSVSCQKENLSVSADQAVKALPEAIVPYENSLLQPREELRNQIALSLGKAISKDAVFKKELFDLLTRSKGRSLVNIPVLMFLNKQFTSGTGKEILALHLTNDDQISFRSEGDRIQQMVGDLEPSMTIEIPVFVRSYFLMPETINIPLSDFTQFPFAIYPETSQANSQGVLVGYGDTISTNSDGVYGVYPSSAYENHIPIHVKRSRSLVLIENRIVHGTGLPENEYVQRLFPAVSPSCIDGLIDSFSDTPDFLEPGKKYLNVIGLSKNIRTVCPPPPPLAEEDCSNGIDDDGDGLIDGADPDCQGVELCSNGIDDDGDGLIDGADPDCQLSCPEDAVYYRDCEVNVNRITGGRFESVNQYTEVVNPLLPALESHINLTFNFFRILNIENCGSPCPLNRATTNDTKSAVSVFLHGDILTDPNLGDGDVYWSDSYEYFEGQFDRDLTSDRISYFLIRAQTDEHSVPPGAHRIGSVGYVVGGFNFPWPTEVEALEAYVVTSNWVNYATPSIDDLERSDGISYTRTGNTGPDWDAAYIGDFIQIDVRETDLISVSVENGETTTNTQSDTRNVEFTGSIGRTFGAELGGISTENNSSAGFTFGTSSTTTNQVTSSTQYTISSERLGNNNTFNLRYQDVADRSQYPSYRNLFVVENANTFGLGNEFSYGHSPESRSTWDRDPFSLATSSNFEEPYQLLGEEGGSLRFINVIRKPDDE